MIKLFLAHPASERCIFSSRVEILLHFVVDVRECRVTLSAVSSHRRRHSTTMFSASTMTDVCWYISYDLPQCSYSALWKLNGEQSSTKHRRFIQVSWSHEGIRHKTSTENCKWWSFGTCVSWVSSAWKTIFWLCDFTHLLDFKLNRKSSPNAVVSCVTRRIAYAMTPQNLVFPSRCFYFDWLEDEAFKSFTLTPKNRVR